MTIRRVSAEHKRRRRTWSLDYLYLTKAPGLLQCVQMGTIEFHGWMNRTDALEQPGRMIFDLYPDEGLSWAEVKRAAADIRAWLADLGLVSFAMLSGGKSRTGLADRLRAGAAGDR